MQIILSAIPDVDYYSVEAGIADNIKHFDHHGKFKNFPSPCNNEKIPKIPNNSKVYITHLDADTFIGLLRLYGKKLPPLDFKLMERIDNNGSSFLKDFSNKTFLYMEGIHEVSNILKFPKTSQNELDVTDIIETIIFTNYTEIIELGKYAVEKSEKSYKDNLYFESTNIGLWVVKNEDSFNPSRPYRDGFDIVIIYNKDYKTISIFCNPKSHYEFGNKIINNILFMGHAKACGSPRGKEYSLDDVKLVYKAIRDMI